jgi:IstB-like ATP binding protein
MHDAAEALPAVLDAAAAEGLTTTAALEQLLAIEVSASQARRLAGRLRFASLPTPATLEDFDYAAAPAVVAPPGLMPVLYRETLPSARPGWMRGRGRFRAQHPLCENGEESGYLMTPGYRAHHASRIKDP